MVMVLLIWKDESKSPVFTVNFPKDFFAYTKNCLSTCILRVGDGQGGLACCNSRGRKESDTTERLIWSDLIGITLLNTLCNHIINTIQYYRTERYVTQTNNGLKKKVRHSVKTNKILMSCALSLIQILPNNWSVQFSTRSEGAFPFLTTSTL